MSFPKTLSAAACLGLAGCSFAPPYQTPDSPVADTWRSQTSAPLEVAEHVSQKTWRQVFPDPELRALIEAALQHNRDIRIALLRIDEAKTRYGIQSAEQLPSLSAGASNQRQLTPAAASPFGMASISDSANAGLAITAFELDLWGRVRNLKDAANAEYQATVGDMQAAQIMLVSEVALSYFDYLAQIELLRQTQAVLETAGLSRTLTARRAAEGLAAELDLRQAESFFYSTQADAADQLRRRALAFNKLEFIVGKPLDPEQFLAQNLTDSSMIAELPPGLPSALIARRPDIMAAEFRLRSANANIGAARAAFLPSISLSGQYGGASSDLSTLFTGVARSWSFTPKIDLPLFDAGRNRMQLDLSWNRKNVAIADYEKSIQSAFREVADALDSGQPLIQLRDAQNNKLITESRRVAIAQQLYDNGMSSHLELLDAQRSLSAAQQALINSRLALLSNRLALYKALGGGWM